MCLQSVDHGLEALQAALPAENVQTVGEPWAGWRLGDGDADQAE
jgi:hypothetical protein